MNNRGCLCDPDSRSPVPEPAPWQLLPRAQGARGQSRAQVVEVVLRYGVEQVIPSALKPRFLEVRVLSSHHGSNPSSAVILPCFLRLRLLSVPEVLSPDSVIPALFSQESRLTWSSWVAKGYSFYVFALTKLPALGRFPWGRLWFIRGGLPKRC